VWNLSTHKHPNFSTNNKRANKATHGRAHDVSDNWCSSHVDSYIAYGSPHTYTIDSTHKDANPSAVL
jgi:hypothetical protein